jgi:maltose/maltodextrin transport system substrate-binding protein/arabinogalactan oligomer/maltooligosaccharide transport system substrate-binding protein
MLSAFSEQPLVAQAFLQQFVATPEVMMALHEAGGRPSAMTSVNEQIEDPEVQAFGEAGVVGQPMPNIPEMSAVWSAWGSAMQLVGQQTATPEDALNDAQAQIEASIAGE